MTDPTLPEMRTLLADVYHEIDNHGADTEIGSLCARAYDTLRWLLEQGKWPFSVEGRRPGE